MIGVKFNDYSRWFAFNGGDADLDNNEFSFSGGHPFYELKFGELKLDSDGNIYFDTYAADLTKHRAYMVASDYGGQLYCALSLDKNLYSGGVFLKLESSYNNIRIQSGAIAGQIININCVDVTTHGLESDDSKLAVLTHQTAGNSISRIDNAISKVSSYRSYFGAT